MSTKIYDLAKEAASKAVEHDQKKEYNLAVSQYLRAFDLLMSLVKYTENKRLNQYYAQTAEKYLNRVYAIKEEQ